MDTIWMWNTMHARPGGWPARLRGEPSFTPTLNTTTPAVSLRRSRCGGRPEMQGGGGRKHGGSRLRVSYPYWSRPALTRPLVTVSPFGRRGVTCAAALTRASSPAPPVSVPRPAPPARRRSRSNYTQVPSTRSRGRPGTQLYSIISQVGHSLPTVVFHKQANVRNRPEAM